MDFYNTHLPCKSFEHLNTLDFVCELLTGLGWKHFRHGRAHTERPRVSAAPRRPGRSRRAAGSAQKNGRGQHSLRQVFLPTNRLSFLDAFFFQGAKGSNVGRAWDQRGTTVAYRRKSPAASPATFALPSASYTSGRRAWRAGWPSRMSASQPENESESSLCGCRRRWRLRRRRAPSAKKQTDIATRGGRSACAPRPLGVRAPQRRRRPQRGRGMRSGRVAGGHGRGRAGCGGDQWRHQLQTDKAQRTRARRQTTAQIRRISAHGG